MELTGNVAGIIKLLGGGEGSTVTIEPLISSGLQIAKVTIDGDELYLYIPTPQDVSVDTVLSSGTKIAEISINNETVEIYAPSPTTVNVTPAFNAGTKIADISVNGVNKELYAPGINHVYSNTEQVVGVWVDGRPIYEKTIIVNAPTGAGTFDLVTLDADIDLIVSQSAFMYSSSYIRYLPYTDIGNYDTNIYYNLPTIKLTVDNDNWTGYQVYITIQYTKSTDTPTRELLVLDLS